MRREAPGELEGAATQVRRLLARAPGTGDFGQRPFLQAGSSSCFLHGSCEGCSVQRGSPGLPRVAGHRAAVSGQLCRGSAWGRADPGKGSPPSEAGRRAQLKIPRPGSCLAFSGLCDPGHSSRRAFSSPVSLFSGTSHPFTETGQNFHSGSGMAFPSCGLFLVWLFDCC